MFQVVVLGSGQDGASPQLGIESGRGPDRTASSLAVVAGDGTCALFDASPDLRVQQRHLFDLPGYRTSRRRRFPVDAVFLTHAHMGHYAGLVHFGAEAAAAEGVPCWASSRMLDFLRTHEPWAQLFARGHLIGSRLDPGSKTSPVPGLEVAAVPVPHRDELSDTVAFSIRVDDSQLLYLPDIDGWAEWAETDAVIARHDIALIDGTFFSDDELPDRPITSIAHPLILDSIERFESLDTRVIFTHLNWSNPAADPSGEAAGRVRAAGMEVAFDGMTIDLG